LEESAKSDVSDLLLQVAGEQAEAFVDAQRLEQALLQFRIFAEIERG
jgi:hypothetical protein